MTTKELIARLQESDPDGDTHVVVGNCPIYSVHREPAYWDGRMASLIEDESRKPFYSIVGIKFHSTGDKITLGIIDPYEHFFHEPNDQLDLSDLTPQMAESVMAAVEKERAERREFDASQAAKKA